jgi:hypothetical protein
VLGEVAESFTIEQPGITWDSIEVLGAEVLQTEGHEELLTITLNKPVVSPAVVVRYNLP